MMNFVFGMLVMYLISGFCYMCEDLFAPSNRWYTPLPDIFYMPITAVFKIIQVVFTVLRHPVIFIKYFIKKSQKRLDNSRLI